MRGVLGVILNVLLNGRNDLLIGLQIGLLIGLLNVDLHLSLSRLRLIIWLDFLANILLVETKLLDDSIGKFGCEFLVVGTQFIRRSVSLDLLVLDRDNRIGLVNLGEDRSQIDNGLSQGGLRFEQGSRVDIFAAGPRDGVLSELVDALLKNLVLGWH